LKDGVGFDSFISDPSILLSLFWDSPPFLRIFAVFRMEFGQCADLLYGGDGQIELPRGQNN
jgi:hypothetical protein